MHGIWKTSEEDIQVEEEWREQLTVFCNEDLHVLQRSHYFYNTEM
jgi:hypothetical protein